MTDLIVRQFSQPSPIDRNEDSPQTRRQLGIVTFASPCILLPYNSKNLGVVMHGLDLCLENGEYHTRHQKQLLNSAVIVKSSDLMMQVCGLESQASIAFLVPKVPQGHDVCRKF